MLKESNGGRGMTMGWGTVEAESPPAGGKGTSRVGGRVPKTHQETLVLLRASLFHFIYI